MNVSVKSLATLVALFLLSVAAQAQSTFTEHVKHQQKGYGKVIILQDSIIEQIVNNALPNTPAANATGEGQGNNGDKENSEMEKKKQEYLSGGGNNTHRVQKKGFRIQIYSGNNTKHDKDEAEALMKKCQKAFPELSGYVRYRNPRWECVMGDFVDRETALEYAEKIRNKRITRFVRILADKVFVRE